MTKPVALADETYRRLRRRRRPGESFSGAIDRLLREQRKDPLHFLETVPRSKVSSRRRLKAIQADRDASWEAA